MILEELEDKLDWLNKGMQAITGTKETFVWANDKIKSFGLSGFDAMIENKLEGALHSGKLVMALTRKVQSLGVDIITGIDIMHYEENELQRLYLLQNKTYHLLHSSMIVCSNAFTNQFLY